MGKPGKVLPRPKPKGSGIKPVTGAPAVRIGSSRTTPEKQPGR